MMTYYVKKLEKYTGCDDNCFICKYKDCRIPDNKIRISKEEALMLKSLFPSKEKENRDAS